MLRHKNIVEFYGSESTHQHRLIFMEYVSERSLSHVVADYGPLEEVTVKLYLRQVLEAVAYMHRKGIVHRDIKASNVLVGGDGQIKLSDFGCATNSNS
jgi:serine/threonine protein kinase